MKVNGPNGVSTPQASRGAGPSGASGFSLSAGAGAGEAAPTTRSMAATGVGSLDALLALQGVGGPLERRRKAVRRAGVILDVLDDVKMALPRRRGGAGGAGSADQCGASGTRRGR